MRVLVTGGAGYLGSVLVPVLLARGDDVTVVDTFLYGDTLQPHDRLRKHHIDLRSFQMTQLNVGDQDAVIHLACISNDPSFELDPVLGKSVNYDATVKLVETSKQACVSRFIYASSSSVYGFKPDAIDVTEAMSLGPQTDYSRYKAMGEDVVLKAQSSDFTTTVLRPATLCGYAPRLRLDLVVNILTSKAYHTHTIPVLGGTQLRPNLHVTDMVRAYLAVLDAPSAVVAGQVFNVGCENASVRELAERVQAITGGAIVDRPTDDKRSYAVNSDKITRVLGFRPRHSIEDAVHDLLRAFQLGWVPNAMDDPRYYNIRQMQACHIS